MKIKFCMQRLRFFFCNFFHSMVEIFFDFFFFSWNERLRRIILEKGIQIQGKNRSKMHYLRPHICARIFFIRFNDVEARGTKKFFYCNIEKHYFLLELR